MATADAIKNEEYEAQFFEFSPSAFFEEVKGIINDRLCEGMDQLEYQLKQIPEEILPKAEVTQGMATLRQHTETNYLKTIQKLETHILGNLMKVPPQILLPSDIEQATQVSGSDIAMFQAEIDSLQEQLKNERYLHAKYREELLEIKEVLEHQDKLKEEMMSPTQVAFAEDLKDKLTFLHENEADLIRASSAAKNNLKSIALNEGPSAAQLWSLYAMQ